MLVFQITEETRTESDWQTRYSFIAGENASRGKLKFNSTLYGKKYNWPGPVSWRSRKVFAPETVVANSQTPSYDFRNFMLIFSYLNRSSLHTRSLSSKRFSVFQHRLTKKMALRARTVSRAIEKQAPGIFVKSGRGPETKKNKISQRKGYIRSSYYENLKLKKTTKINLMPFRTT